MENSEHQYRLPTFIINMAHKGTTERVDQLVGSCSNLTKSLGFESLGTQLRLNHSIRRALPSLWSYPARIWISQRPIQCSNTRWFNQKIWPRRVTQKVLLHHPNSCLLSQTIYSQKYLSDSQTPNL